MALGRGPSWEEMILLAKSPDWFLSTNIQAVVLSEAGPPSSPWDPLN